MCVCLYNFQVTIYESLIHIDNTFPYKIVFVSTEKKKKKKVKEEPVEIKEETANDSENEDGDSDDATEEIENKPETDSQCKYIQINRKKGNKLVLFWKAIPISAKRKQ